MNTNMKIYKDLEQEVKDAQFAFDADWSSLVNSIDFIKRSKEYLDQCTQKLYEFNQKQI